MTLLARFLHYRGSQRSRAVKCMLLIIISETLKSVVCARVCVCILKCYCVILITHTWETHVES